MGRLRKKAQALDSLIRKAAPWWPTYEQTEKAAKKVKKATNPNMSVTGTIGASIKRIGEGPGRAMGKGKDHNPCSIGRKPK
jgi:hypothetical protein